MGNYKSNCVYVLFNNYIHEKLGVLFMIERLKDNGMKLVM